MASPNKIEANRIDQQVQQKIIEDPEHQNRIERMLPYLVLDMLLKSKQLSLYQMVIAAGTEFGLLSEFEKLLSDLETRELVIRIKKGDEIFYKIDDEEKAQKVFLGINQKKSNE